VPSGSTTGKILVNGSEKASGSLNNLNNTTRAVNHIGTDNSESANFYSGSIAELLIYNRLLTTSEQTAIEAYLMQKYQIRSQTPPAPTISIASGTLSEPTQVVLSSKNNLPIYYTTDGSTPTSSSTLYTTPINVYYSQTIKAIVIQDGITSSITSASYTLNSTDWPAPDAGDMTPLDIKLQQPNKAVPQ
jgi:hypothetical protein